MRYDFDFSTEAAPRGTNSVKWDSCPENVIPMWVAEMDFPAAPCIIKALQERVSKGVFGYTLVPDSYYESVMNGSAAGTDGALPASRSSRCRA